MRSYVVRCWRPSNSGVAPEMAIVPFVLIGADHDNRIFSVEGPMVDDDPWSKPVVDAQDSGKRHINCFVQEVRCEFAVGHSGGGVAGIADDLLHSGQGG